MDVRAPVPVIGCYSPRGLGRRVSAKGMARLWGENCGEWIAAFLGCLFCGAIVVPMDAIADKAFARRVAQQAGVRLVVAGRGLPSLDLPLPAMVLEDLGEAANAENFSLPAFAAQRPRRNCVYLRNYRGASRSGAHARNLLANLAPIEKRDRALSPL